ncbi:hypothetical protein [Roseibium sp.]|uniref:hypothetical protein n=1 Tax=Roseibium sp. TaxID=1936156 RepID=UPI003D0CF219
MSKILSMGVRAFTAFVVSILLIISAVAEPWPLRFLEVKPSASTRVDLSFVGRHSVLVVLPYVRTIGKVKGHVYLIYWNNKPFTTQQGDCWISGYTSVPPGSHASVMYITGELKQWAWYYGHGISSTKFSGKPGGAVVQCVLST